MPASAILNRLACELFCDDKLVEIYENLCERLVLHDDVTEPENEQISEQFIQRVSNIKKTDIFVFLKMQPSTSKNSNLNTFVGGNVTISNGFKYFNVICKDENPIKKFKILDKTMVFKFKEISESRNSFTWLENAFNEVIGYWLEKLIGISFRRRDQFNSKVVMATLDNILQSATYFYQSDGFTIGLCGVTNRVWCIQQDGRCYEEFCKRKQGITVISNEGNLYLARALVVAVA